MKGEDVRKALAAFDGHPNKTLTIAQIDQALRPIDPELCKNREAIMNAYQATEVTTKGCIKKDEFPFFLEVLIQYEKFLKQFNKLDSDGDKRITFEEFKSNRRTIGLEDGTARQEFDAIDSNKGGYILFKEFATYMAKRKVKKDREDFEKKMGKDALKLDNIAEYFVRKNRT